MMRQFLTACTLFFLCASLHAQTTITWDDLLDVRYATTFDGDAGYVYMKPTYGPKLLDLDGEMVEIRGYVLPMDTEGTAYALSAFPYSACFFCGGGSRESILELQLAEIVRYSTDDVVTFRGVFRLNDDQFGLNYVLEEAEEKP